MLNTNVPLDRTEHFIAVHPRHNRICNYQMRLFLQGNLKTLSTVRSFKKIVPFSFQSSYCCSANQILIVNDR